ncbi:MAG: tRNA (N(6)-L-threonylcarbamoyladenosine(37)-C(2))-methylthiotransferase MtaB [Anaerolineales bacterium]|jgi:threonylcarbamoyladenosine tRNA methylthiotransferase MtaB
MKIYLDTIGCRLNQSEIESMARQFRAAGHEIVASAAEADLAVVNTCTVTAEAASDSRAAIRRATRRGAGEVIVTGCWATLEPDKAAELAGVHKVILNSKKDTLVADLLELPQEYFDLEPLARTPLPGLRGRTRAFVKVQDGCNNRCTFCITTVARGASRSRSAVQVIADVRSALDGGTQEVVLTGVHLGAWGQDLDPPLRLADLVSAILARTSVPRLRLSSLEPWDLQPSFFELWADPRLCRHLHLPLQSGSAGVLRRMARKTSPEAFAALLASARACISEVAVTTDVIVGFPGETDEEFAETEAFVRAMQFAGGHVFTYSARPGTAAARLPGQVETGIRKTRNACLRSTFLEAARHYRSQFLGRTMPVLWEATDQLSQSGWRLEGLTDNYLRVSASAGEPRWNQIDAVRLTGLSDEGLLGEIQE